MGPEGLKANIALEGVGAQTTIKDEDARAMSFANGSMDVVLSNPCPSTTSTRSRDARRHAAKLREELKPGGVAS